MFELVNKKTKKVVDATYKMNMTKGGYDILHKNGKEEFLKVADFNKKYATKLVQENLQDGNVQEDKKELAKTKVTKPKVPKEDTSKEAPISPVEVKEPTKRGIEPSPIVDMVRKAYKDFADLDKDITQDVKTKVTNFKYKGRVLVEIHYQKRQVKCLFNEKGLSEKNLNLCTMVNPLFKWSTNAEYKVLTEAQIPIMLDMLKECFTYRKNDFASIEAKKKLKEA